MKVLAICRPRPDTEFSEIVKHLPEEAKALEGWRDEGILLEAYSPGGPGAVLILDVMDAESATSLLSALPLRIAGLIEIETISLYPLEY
jgi:hypothetical protein